MSSEILKAINDAVEKRLFTPEGLEAAVALRTKADAMEKQLEMLRTQVTAASNALEAKRTELNAANAAVNAWEAREADLVKREKTVFESEKASAVNFARAEAYKDAFHITFRNPVISETVMRNGSINGGGGGYQNTTDATTTTRTTT